MKSSLVLLVVLLCALLGACASAPAERAPTVTFPAPASSPGTSPTPGATLTQAQADLPLPKATITPIRVESLPTRVATQLPSFDPAALQPGEDYQIALEAGQGLQLFDFSSGRLRGLLATNGILMEGSAPYWFWSPDGKLLLYIKYESAQAGGSQVTSSLRLLDLINGRESVLFEQQNDYPIYIPIAWHPGGRLAAAGNQLFNLDQLPLVSVLPGPIQSLSFSPDGSRIATVRDTGTMQIVTIYTIDLDISGQFAGWQFLQSCALLQREGKMGWTCSPNDPAQMSEEEKANFSWWQPILQMSWSPGGDQLALLAQTDGLNLYRVGADGSGLRDLAKMAQRPGMELIPYFAWSPDGQAIAFSASETGAPSQQHTFVTQIQDGSTVEITGGVIGSGSAPAWTPDGQWIVVHQLDAASDRLWRVRPDGSQAQALPETLFGAKYDFRPGTVGTAEEAAGPACPGALPSRLSAGQTGRVSSDPGGANRVRTDPSLNAAVLGEILPGQTFLVLEGPRCAEGWAWYRVRTTDQDLQGWTVEGDGKDYWLEP